MCKLIFNRNEKKIWLYCNNCGRLKLVFSSGCKHVHCIFNLTKHNYETIFKIDTHTKEKIVWKSNERKQKKKEESIKIHCTSLFRTLLFTSSFLLMAYFSSTYFSKPFFPPFHVTQIFWIKFLLKISWKSIIRWILWYDDRERVLSTVRHFTHCVFKMSNTFLVK